MTVRCTYFSQLAFDHALTGCITVSFSVCSLTMLSQVALQFLFHLTLLSQVALATVSFLVCSLTMLSQVALQLLFVTLLFDYYTCFASCTGACVTVSAMVMLPRVACVFLSQILPGEESVLRSQ